jgi:hypothetical protein
MFMDYGYDLNFSISFYPYLTMGVHGSGIFWILNFCDFLFFHHFTCIIDFSGFLFLHHSSCIMHFGLWWYLVAF